MRRPASLLLLLTAAACAQTMVPPGQMARLLAEFQPQAGDAPLRCDVTPLVPILNFAFRYEAGYTFRVPQAQYQGPIRGWSELTSITPEDGSGKAVLLLARQQPGEVTRTDLNFEMHGVYLLGVGSYAVDSVIRDDRNRICRKQWRVVVQPSRAERAVESALPAYAIRPFSAASSADTLHLDKIAPMRVTVLLNAAAFSMRRTVMRPADRLVLVNALTALLERVPTAIVHVVVFSLEQQREIYRSDSFSLSGLGPVANAISSLELSKIDVRVLEKPFGHVNFLADLVHRELNAPVPADTVIFVGPPSRYENKIPAAVLPKPSIPYPRFFYLQYQGPRRINPASFSQDLALSSPGGRMGRAGAPTGAGSDAGLGDPSSSMDMPAPPRPPPQSNNGNSNNTDNSAGANANSNSNSGTAGSRPGGSGGGGGGGGAGGGGRGGNNTSRGLPPLPQATEVHDLDIIHAAVARLKGKTFALHTPADLAKAIRKIEQSSR